jgi:hypothetical protein
MAGRPIIVLATGQDLCAEALVLDPASEPPRRSAAMRRDRVTTGEIRRMIAAP